MSVDGRRWFWDYGLLVPLFRASELRSPEYFQRIIKRLWFELEAVAPPELARELRRRRVEVLERPRPQRRISAIKGILHALRSHPRGLTAAEIHVHTGADPTHVRRTLRVLEKQGVVHAEGKRPRRWKLRGELSHVSRRA